MMMMMISKYRILNSHQPKMSKGFNRIHAWVTKFWKDPKVKSLVSGFVNMHRVRVFSFEHIYKYFMSNSLDKKKLLLLWEAE